MSGENLKYGLQESYKISRLYFNYVLQDAKKSLMGSDLTLVGLMRVNKKLTVSSECLN